MNNYICIFCNERKRHDTAAVISGNIGICRDCAAKLPRTAPSLPYKGTRNVSYVMSPFEYTDKLRRTIIDFKFNSLSAYAPLFAELMKEYLLSYDVWEQFDYIIPVPLHEERLRERGYNQSELISRHVSEFLNIEHNTTGLIRARATKRQSRLSNMERVANVKNAFTCTESFADKSVLIFDDICTTGSTLDSCAEALKDAGAIYVCALTLSISTEKELPPFMY